MEVEIDQALLDAAVIEALDAQDPEVRAELLEVLASEPVQVHVGPSGLGEYFYVVVADQAIARVHRSRLERAVYP